MGVDGFRFDLASVFARNEDGSINTESPAIATELTAAALVFDLRLVAEAWDIDAYLLGRSFPGLAWRQWNGQFRDDLRSFVKGDAGMVGALMRRLYGSDDLFPDGPGDVYRPYQTVNYITSHDGFASTISSPTAKNTMRRTATEIATGRPIIEVGTAAGKATMARRPKYWLYGASR